MPAIDPLFEELLARGLTDLHISVGHPPLARERGVLVPLDDRSVAEDELAELLYPLLSPEQRERFSSELDLSFAYTHAGRARFRASYFHQASGVAAVFRAVPTALPILAELGVPGVARSLAEKRGGLVLVAGPRRSGRSTTLAAMVHHINETRACHILTIEDPVEFVHAPIKSEITHREVGRHAPHVVAALRSARAEDADVVMVAELVGADATRLALQLASSGVLVLAALDATTAPAAIDRVLSTFAATEQMAARAMLAESLAGVLVQILLEAADGEGRAPAHEILLGTSAVASMIREGRTYELRGVMQGGHAVGMQTADQAIERLVASGRVTYDVAVLSYTDGDNAEKKLRPAAT
jgi:twitching motility protein PilT